jgi:hypothetical protein
LDAFQFVYARGADRRLFQVVDGPAAEHWERLHLISGKRRGLPFTPKEAGEAFGVSDRQARRVLTQWEQVGAVSEFERGRYVLAGYIVEAAARIQEHVQKH